MIYLLYTTTVPMKVYYEILYTTIVPRKVCYEPEALLGFMSSPRMSTTEDRHSTNPSSFWTAPVPAATIYGKVARVLHTLVVLLLLLSSAWSVVSPRDEGTACALEAFDPYVVRYLQGLIQLLNWWGVGFFIQSLVCSIKNVVLLMLLLVGACYINHSFTKTLIDMDPERVTEECFGGLVLFVVVVCVVELAVLVLVGADHVLSRRGTIEARESTSQPAQQPLLR